MGRSMLRTRTRGAIPERFKSVCALNPVGPTRTASVLARCPHGVYGVPPPLSQADMPARGSASPGRGRRTARCILRHRVGGSAAMPRHCRPRRTPIRTVLCGPPTLPRLAPLRRSRRGLCRGGSVTGALPGPVARGTRCPGTSPAPLPSPPHAKPHPARHLLLLSQYQRPPPPPTRIAG